ncbi:MAG: hypothetical protein H0V73_11860 [Chloroflexi bacterium]|nr:hypothetical protein [Chloroflexota bacterium]
MRRIAIIFSLTLGMLLPGAVSAAAQRCSVSITPAAGSPTGVYRIAVGGVPVDQAGGSVEVRLDLRRTGSRDGSIYFVFLIPGVTDFYVDHNVAYEGEPPPDPLVPGRYLVQVDTPHLRGGCHTVGQFVVEPAL